MSARIVKGMAAHLYHSDPALGSGAIRELLRSPKHFAAYRDNGTRATPAMQRGTFAHTATLEPGLWEAKHWRGIEGDGRTKAVKDARAEQERVAAASGAIIVPPDDYDVACRIARAVRSHAGAAHLLRFATDFEVSIFWEDEETGVPCKARIDFVSRTPAGLILGDLKTTTDASEENAAKSIVLYGLDGQGAHYWNGYETASGEKVAGYALVFAESERPHDVLVRTLGEATLERGRTRRLKALDLWADCNASGKWPGRDERIGTIDVPAWAL